MRPPLWSVLAAGAMVALWVDLSAHHHGHHADSLVPVLTSLYSWRPFYWGQDRFGMLLPLLAMPFKHPLVNLLTQAWLSAFAGLAALFLLPRYVLPDRTWLAVGLSATAPFLALAPETYRFLALSIGQPYYLAAALGLGGLVLLERPLRERASGSTIATVVVGFLLLALAHWVNVAAPVFLGPVLVARWLAARATRRAAERRPPAATDSAGPVAAISAPTLSAGLAVVVGGLVGLAAKWLANIPSTSAELRPVSEWLDGTGELVQSAWSDLGTSSSWPAAAMVLGLLGLLCLLAPSGRRGAAPELWAALGLLGGALAGAVVVGGTEWVRMNHFSSRYLMSSLLLAQTALAIPAAWPLGTLLRVRSPAACLTATLAVLLTATTVSYGTPSLAEVRTVIDDRTGHRTAEILAARCTHIAGAYWRVWPAVFHANLVLHELGERRVIWGVALRSEAQRGAWRRVPRGELRVAVIPDDAEAFGYLERGGFTRLVVVQKSEGIWVLRSAETVAPGEAIEPYVGAEGGARPGA